jgi:hypothetical protein
MIAKQQGIVVHELDVQLLDESHVNTKVVVAKHENKEDDIKQRF